MSKAKDPIHPQAGQARFICLGALRRDTMILGSSEDQEEMAKLGEEAVKQGRASETFVLAVIAYNSETHQNWRNPDFFAIGTPTAGEVAGGIPGQGGPDEKAQLPLLNPGAGPQQTDEDPNKSPLPLTSIREEAQRESEATRTPDTKPGSEMTAGTTSHDEPQVVEPGEPDPLADLKK